MAENINELVQSYLKKNNDFGFSTFNSEDVVKATESRVKMENSNAMLEYESRLRKIEELIMPLLSNLYDSGDKDVIKWPNRREQLEPKIKEFLRLTRGE